MKSGLLLLVPLFAACGVENTETIPPTAKPSAEAPASRPTTDVRNLDAAAAAKLLADDEKVVVVDVRTPAEYAEGHIDGAVNIDFKAADFADKLAELDRATPYLVHCRSGGRSTAALEQFRKLGFATVYHLDGGMLAWDAARKK